MNMKLPALVDRPLLLLVLTLVLAGWPSHAQQASRPPPQEMWLPYGDGETALCGQGPFSQGTHRGVHAWDFVLDEGKPLVAAAAGRIVRVIDHRSRTDVNDFNESNHIFIDHGDGVYSTYGHHKTGTAHVQPGDLVAAGTKLAEVGRVGTFTPHIHFDVRRSSWHLSQDVRFRQAGPGASPVVQGRAYLSATRPGPYPGNFQDSRLGGDEFAANGVRLDGGQRSFWMPAEPSVSYKGQISPLCTEVVFYLWQDGQTSEYVARARPDATGRFTLEVRLPRSSRGPRWYRITARDSANRIPDVATLPVCVE